MNNNKYRNFLVARECPDGFGKSIMGIPRMRKINIPNEVINSLKYASYSNMSSVKDKASTMLTGFQFDYTINRYWNDPLRYIKYIKDFLCVATPDFSAYTNMDEIEIAHNVYKNRWIGCWWQSLDINCIPTISWANEDTYKYCFAGVEKGSDVIISTISNSNSKDNFLKGYNKMLEVIEPKTIFVKGNLIDGMVGNIVNIKFKDTFSQRIIGGK